MEISCAVTTAPRNVSYLEATIQSILDAGFPYPIVAEDDNRRGAWATWQYAIKMALVEDSDAIMIFQDDIQCARGLADWLHWPVSQIEMIGACALYHPVIPPEYGPSSEREGWNRVHFPEGPGWAIMADGACALLMPRGSAEELADFQWDSKTRIDHAVGTYCRMRGRSFWRHNPSLIEHVGDVSAINPKRQTIRRASLFVDDVAKLKGES